MTPQLLIATGAPGTGKTTVLHQLASDVTLVPEPARLVLAELGSSADLPFEPFVALLLAKALAQYEEAAARTGTSVFDRGVADCAAYALYFGVDPGPCLEAADRCRYYDSVLLFEPWEMIYATDELRTMTFEMTVAFHEAVVEAYHRTGYDTVIVPRGPVEERAELVDEFIAGASRRGRNAMGTR